MKAYDIQWSYDVDEAVERLDNLPLSEAADVMEIEESKYVSLSPEERADLLVSKIRRCPGWADEFFNLPVEVEIPECLEDDEEISDWLSDEFGFCHEGFSLKP